MQSNSIIEWMPAEAGWGIEMDFIGRIEDDEKLAEEEQIVIYGAGTIGKRAFKFLEERGIAGKVKAFCDSNPAASGMEIKGKKVLSLEEAGSEYPAAAYLVASCCVRQMTENLQGQGITKIHIIRC